MGELAGDPTISFEEYVALQKDKILSPFNKWVTGEKVGRTPTSEELAFNYIESGGAADHEKEYGPRLKP